MMRMLVSGEADLSNAGLQEYGDRAASVDFSLALAPIKLTLISGGGGGQETDMYVWSFLEVFAKSTWMAIGGLFLAVGLGFYNLLLLRNDDAVGNGLLMRFVWSNVLPERIAGDAALRCILFSSWAAYFLLYSYYGSDIMSQLAAGSEMKLVNMGHVLSNATSSLN